jgi:hypothetical protein
MMYEIITATVMTTYLVEERTEVFTYLERPLPWSVV